MSKAREFRNARDRERPPSNEAPFGCLVAFLSIFIIAGLTLFIAFTVRPAVQVMLASDWVETPCTILTSEVEEHSGDDGSTYRIAITYRYTFDGESYSGDRYDFTGAATGGRKQKERVVAEYPPGAERSCFVDPGAPEDSVLVVQVGATFLFGFFGFVFMAIPLAIIVIGRRAKRRKEGPRAGRATHRSGGDRAGGARPQRGKPVAATAIETSPSGHAELRRKSSPLGKLLGLGFIALFWNGIVSVFVTQVLVSESGIFRWGLAIFLIPFVLIGLALLGATAHAFLSLFSPRATLTLRRGTIHPGDTVEFAWEFTGRTQSMTSLVITLVGKERATHQVGTNTRTDEHRFHETTLIERTTGEDLTFGTGELTIPATSLPTFRSRNNQVVWFLEVAGEIPRWPDVKSEFPVPVLPHPVDGLDPPPPEPNEGEMR